jgi:hypothetical protein
MRFIKEIHRIFMFVIAKHGPQAKHARQAQIWSARETRCAGKKKRPASGAAKRNTVHLED